MVAERLNDVMRESAHQHLWSFVDGHRAAFRGRGLCAGYSDAPWTMADELRVPRKVNGAWEPFNPSQWRAYAPRQRLFRTPNDAYMTGNFHVAQSLMQRAMNKQGYGWVQLLLASVYSGAFHPSAEGQAAIADAVVAQVPRCARQVREAHQSRTHSRQSRPRRGTRRELRLTCIGATVAMRCTQRRIRANRPASATPPHGVRLHGCTTARNVPATAAPTR